MENLKIPLSVLLCFVFLNTHSQNVRTSFALNENKTEMLKYFLQGEPDKATGYIKWKPSLADIYEFQGTNPDGDGYLYSKVDTFFTSKNTADLSVLIFHTMPMMEENGEKRSASNCHACGVSIGYIAFAKDADSLFFGSLDKNFASHGSFGEAAYKLSAINLSEGYDIIRVDDPYEGMGVHSVTSTFYYTGKQVLSLVSSENNSGERKKNEKGYYEFKTGYSYNKKNRSITLKQTGYNIDEKTGKKTTINKSKTFVFDGNTMQF